MTIQRERSRRLFNRPWTAFTPIACAVPDCGHLLAHIMVSEGQLLSEAMAWLRQNQSRLRTEVAMSISRKRAPELAFVPAVITGGEND